MTEHTGDYALPSPDRLPCAEAPWKRERWTRSRWQYEYLRVVMKDHGWDPELAMEDEGYGIGVHWPNGVNHPDKAESRRLIDFAKAAHPGREARDE